MSRRARAERRRQRGGRSRPRRPSQGAHSGQAGLAYKGRPLQIRHVK